MAEQPTPSTSSVSRNTVILTFGLTALLGMQLLRSLLPYFQNLLGERLGWGTIDAGMAALLIFLCAFLAGPLNRFFGSGLMLLVTGFSIGLSRLAAQLWTGDPIVKMIFTATGVIAFLIFLPTAVGFVTGSTKRTGFLLAISVLAGLTVDLALNGMFYTYDLVWQRGFWPALIILLLVLLQWGTLFRLLGKTNVTAAGDAHFSRALSWATIGPFLFLQLLTFSNIGWATTSTGWSFVVAFFWLLLAHISGLAIWILPRGFRRAILGAAWIVALICQVLLVINPTDTWITAVYLLSGQVALAGALIATLTNLGDSAVRDGLRNISIAGGIGMVLMVILLFAYYAAYDIALPFSNQTLPLIAMLLVAVFSVAALASYWKHSLQLERSIVRPLTAVLALTLLIPIVMGILNRIDEPETNAGTTSGEAIRVMTYNLHYGANILGQLDLEALAQVIETEQPDVVGLQEVSRGWVINGSADMGVWLANRLDMELVFGPAADAHWGNAILTRLPVVEQSNYPLPTEDLLLRRAYIHAVLSGPGDKTFNFIDTHYHNPSEGKEIRVSQSQAILDYAEGLPRLVMTGDLNAEHGEEEIDMLVEGGLRDVLHLTGVEPGYTNPVPDPSRRIDYVFVTADWQVETAVVPYAEASDHLPVAATLATGN